LAPVIFIRRMKEAWIPAEIIISAMSEAMRDAREGLAMASPFRNSFCKIDTLARRPVNVL
jgi:hypothetical protein